MTSRSRAPRALAVLLAIVLPLSACGGTETTDEPTTEDTISAEGAHGALSEGDFVDRVFGAIDKAGSAKVSFTSETAGATAEGEGEVKYGDEVAVHLKMAGSGNAPDQDILFIGDTLYMGIGGMYVTAPVSSSMRANFDPEAQAKTLKAGMSGFKQTGKSETIDGVKATPYEVTVDPTKSPDVYGTALKDPLTFTFFVGPDDLIRKVVYEADGASFTATYTDWGVPVRIEVPEPGKIVKAPAA